MLLNLHMESTQNLYEAHGCLGVISLYSCWVQGNRANVLGGALFVITYNKTPSVCESNPCLWVVYHRYWLLLRSRDASRHALSTLHANTHMDGTSRIVGMNVLGVLATNHALVFSAALQSLQCAEYHVVSDITGIVSHIPVCSLESPESPEKLSKA